MMTNAESMGIEELFRNVNMTDDWRHNDHERGMVSEHRRSVARGEELFNNTQINITGVAGLNDDLNVESISGILRHLPRLAECRQPFGQGAVEYRRARCRRQKAARCSTLPGCRCSR